jgi:hypothetical protein
MSIAEHEKNEIKSKIKNGNKGYRQYANVLAISKSGTLS